MWNVASSSDHKKRSWLKDPMWVKKANNWGKTLQNLGVSTMEPWYTNAILRDIGVDITHAFFHRLINFPIGVKYRTLCHVEEPCTQYDKRKVSFLPVEGASKRIWVEFHISPPVQFRFWIDLPTYANIKPIATCSQVFCSDSGSSVV